MAASMSLLLAAGLLLVFSTFVNQVSSTDDFYECLPGIPSKGGKVHILSSKYPAIKPNSFYFHFRAKV